jgi:FkbH-like protein
MEPQGTSDTQSKRDNPHMVDNAQLAALDYPFRVDVIHKRKKSLKSSLLKGGPFLDKRIAILGGSTTDEIKDVLELFLLREGIRPQFYQSDYNRYYEDVMFPNEALAQFEPEIIYIHTTQANLTQVPLAADSRDIVEAKLATELTKFTSLWEKIRSTYSCTVIQNNFELPHYRILGNLDFSAFQGRTHFTMRLNLAFAEYAQTHQDFYINDINYQSASFGLAKWHDPTFWHAYKYALSYDAIPTLSHSVARIVTAVYGKSKKCLVLDLDNTVWGGVIGDDGADNIKIGKETAIGEAYSAFQQYATDLKRRGIILAVCSKNDPEIAVQGFSHPDSILSIKDFAAFKVSWDPKYLALRQIASEIKVGLDSLVFVDDNPAERELVRRKITEIAVPDVGADVADFIGFIDRAGYFEPAVLSADDIQRTKFYEANLERQDLQADVADYGEFLASLDMTAEIGPFSPKYLDRLTQLVNKTNQFNLTTRRYSASEIENMSRSPRALTLYGRLRDKFGDNGLISAIAGNVKDATLHIDLWVMSCRVIKRDMEFAMFDELVRECMDRGVNRIVGYYYPTPKNAMVAELFPQLGFTLTTRSETGNTEWAFDVGSSHDAKTIAIKVVR